MITTLLVLLLAVCPSFGEEVDDFTNRPENPKDATASINQGVNLRLQDTVRALKESGLKCDSDREAIRTVLINSLDNNFSEIGKALRNKGSETNSFSGFEKSFRDIDVFGVRKNQDSIYKGTSVTCCIGRVSVGNVQLGIDKIDHFFGNAGILWEEYDRLRLPEPQKTTAIMARNVEQEHSGWGLQAWGVKSYGDLAANWKGLGFWKELIDGPNPFIKCLEGQFALNPSRKFQIEDYVDDAWDESINCSSYSTPESVNTIKSNLKKRSATCPRDPAACERLRQSYKTPLLADHLLSPVCRDPKADFNQVEAPGSMSWSDWKKAAGGVDAGTIKDFFLRKAGVK